ncbi:MAG: hypothetical protein WCW35_15285 [Bacteroidota bacterium]|jgi:hypothetical protein
MIKLRIILFLPLYVILSVGPNILVHTCGGESEAMVATTTTEDPCGCTDEMSADRCCTTEITTIKIDDAQQASIAAGAQPLTVLEIVPVDQTMRLLLPHSDFTQLFLTSFSPPPLTDRTVRNSVFLI